MKRIFGIFFALMVALSLILVPATVSANPGTVTVFTAGVNDNFAMPTEPTSPSSNFLGWLSSMNANLKDFDDPQWDRIVAHTFAGLPQGICEATLEIHLRAGASSLSYNDTISLTFIGDDQNIPLIGPEHWSRRIGSDGTVPGVLPYNWVSPAAFQTVDTIILDLSNLPLAVGQPSSAGNLISALNQHGFLDIYVQDDTDVDYMTLTVTSNCAIVVDIDIKPGSDPNSINPNSKGVIPVAILTTPDFDATTVDAETVRFGPDEAGAVHWALEDVDGDGDTDMVLHFKTQETGFAPGHTSATLTGFTNTGQPIVGTDSIKTVGK